MDLGRAVIAGEAGKRGLKTFCICSSSYQLPSGTMGDGGDLLTCCWKLLESQGQVLVGQPPDFVCSRSGVIFGGKI